MASQDAITALDISASGLSAQKTRMSVIAGNIANANSLVTPDGGPYRRREVTFATAMHTALTEADTREKIGGVTAAAVKVSREPLKTVYDPEHPMANKEGFVQVPNVNVTKEMVDMVAAQREYDANLSAMKAYREMLRTSISILKR
jgi:flagellar basal-body rod protein FlgC